MNGELAQAICLASHGSVWLAAATGDAPDLARSSSTFQYVGALAFRRRKRWVWGREEQTGDVRSWLQGRRAAGIDRLWLEIPGIRPPHAGEHDVAAFSNAGDWGVLGSGSSRAEFWQAMWSVTDLEAADQRIWAVEYVGRPAPAATPHRPDIAAADEQLRLRLSDAAVFARGEGLQSWAEWFDAAAAATDEIPYHPDMLPSEYTPQARTLAAAAARGWVFGGMGSWNDLGFDDAGVQRRYEDVSRQLYGAVLTALVASVNSST